MKRKLTVLLLCVPVFCAGMMVQVSAEEQAAKACKIRILHTNDVHGYYTATDYGNIGFACLKKLAAEQDADLILDAGDIFHGQAFATVEKGMSIAELMKEAGYDAMTLGNHDWSYGADRLKELEEASGVKILASNVGTDTGEKFFDTSYLVKEVTADDGTVLKVGITGVIDDHFYSTAASENVKGLNFGEETAEVSRQAEILRTEEDCDLVLAMAHETDCEDFVKNIRGVDAVIAGHQHVTLDERYADADGKEVPVVESGSYFNNVGILELTIDPETMEVTAAEETLFAGEQAVELGADETLGAKISELEGRQAEVLNAVVGKSEQEYAYSWEEIRVSEQAIGKFVTEAYMGRTGADIAFENAGGIRAGLAVGDVTYGSLISISPYGNVLLTKELKGQEILDILEHSLEIGQACSEVYELQKEATEKDEDPYQYEWPDNSGSYLQFGGITLETDMEKEEGSRIVSAKIGEKELEKETVYTVAMNHYLAESSEYPALAAAEPVTEYGTCEEALKAYAEAAGEQQAKLPVTWDLTEVYASVEDWEKDFERAQELLPKVAEFKGTLNSVQGIYDMIQFVSLGELPKTMTNLYLYAYLGTQLNPADPVFNELNAKILQLYSEQDILLSYVDAELYAMPLEKRQEIFTDPLFTEYAYAFEEYMDPDEEVLGEEAQTVLATLGQAMGSAYNTYNTFAYVDMPDPEITMPDGTTAKLTEELFAEIVYNDAYDREFKRLATDTINGKSQQFLNTYAKLLESTIREGWAYAQLDEYGSTREAVLDASDIESEIYDMIIQAARDGSSEWQRFLNIHKRGLGLTEQYGFDLNTGVSDFEEGMISYEDAVAEVRESLEILGEDYLAVFDEIMQSSHVDVYPSETKVGGAFSLAMGKEHAPYLLLNYMGNGSDVSTIAHEMGHAGYSSLSRMYQNEYFLEPATFTHEVASTTNELLYYNYKMNAAADDEEKLYYLEKILDMFSGTFFMQALYAEFEDYLYQTVEAGGALDAAALGEKWMSLYEEYRGDSVVFLESGKGAWCEIPHFHMRYYVYQYATAVSYASAVVQDILNGEEGALESYKEFLTLGSSARPSELLKTAGVDPLDKTTYDEAIAYYRGMVDEYEKLVDARVK